jgi:hypothetical protein
MRVLIHEIGNAIDALAPAVILPRAEFLLAEAIRAA